MERENGDWAVKVNGLGKFFDSEPPALQTEILKLASRVRCFAGNAFGHDRRRGGGDVQAPSRGRWVFRDLSFEVKMGEVFGIVGGNGSGKTTLLKVLSRVLYPTEGRAEIRGRVSALLAVGTGFNMAFSGRENVYLNGMILGLSRREIDSKFDSIVSFAEIEKSLDEPVRNYSSGMRARLAFSVAAHLESDVVILDEILSVGDAGFREKSLGMIRGMKRSGRTVILVSHNMNAIESFCDRAMVIRDGAIGAIGETRDVIRSYLDAFKNEAQEDLPLKDRTDREGSGRIIVTGYALMTPNGLSLDIPQAGDDIVLVLDYEANSDRDVENVSVGLAIRSEQGSWLARFSTESLASDFGRIPPKGKIKLNIPRFPFSEGRYICGFRIVAENEIADYLPNAFELRAGRGDFFGTGHVDLHSPVYVPHDWSVEALLGGSSTGSKHDK